jgi:creatinine amidohydrolase
MPDQPWPDVAPSTVLLVPVGSFEQHGPHLPLHTDTTIAVAVAERAAEVLTGEWGPVLIGPPIAYGASGEHQSFPGTVSIGTQALHTILVELVRSATTWATRVVLVNGHGGNLAGLRSAVRQLRYEGRDVCWVPCAVPGGDAHAGQVETSVMLHLRPDAVDMGRAEVGNLEPIERLLPALVAGGIVAVSPNGVLGDPRAASAETGARLLEAMTTDVVTRLRSGRPDADGYLATVEIGQS